MFHQVWRAIEPPLPLCETIGNWNSIARDLAENPRRRRNQVEKYFEWE